MPLQSPFTFSQASLQDYQDCVRRFELRYIERLAYPAEESEPALENERRQQEGEHFHRLAQQYFIGLPAEKLARMAASPNLARWWGHFIESRLIQNIQALPRYPEITLSAPLGEHRLLAKYDLIARDGDAFIIYDWKTTHKRPRDEWMAARWQTRVYPALLAKAGAHLNDGNPIQPEQIEMVYWYADYPNEPARFRYSAAKLQRDWGDLLQKVESISRAGAVFPLTEQTERCQFCPYRSYCNRGVRAGSGDEAELEVTTPTLTLETVQEIEF